jgi:hypothetical protein
MHHDVVGDDLVFDLCCPGGARPLIMSAVQHVFVVVVNEGFVTHIQTALDQRAEIAMAVMSKPQGFVLAGHELVAVALDKASHFPGTNWRQRESFFFSH